MRLYEGQRPADREQQLYLEALEVLLETAHLNYRRLRGNAVVFHQTGYEEARVALLADATAFIGTIERIRKVLPKVRGDSTYRRIRKDFQSVVSQFNRPRDHLEHLNQRVPQIAPTGAPIFGGLGWWRIVDENQIEATIAMVGSATGPTLVGEVRAPGYLDPPVDQFTIFLGGARYDLTRAHSAVLQLYFSLRPWLEDQEMMGWPTMRQPLRGVRMTDQA